ncbi:dolichol phosphate-mannose biosynthesis regulatory protein Dpm2 [Polyporus arcularius HHB13444]|uniref:Dolichol phosphate-mannose biosynthesis regulatory protein n=1 Tax=Polyporus arcularius HHB13444 TaxID=1314778 RepID=A0A5C3PJ90_9APHY|nr:dolichol phosphate-mannose biosynthesis regulatory protein Dpm2 [Polyporus arcularius HHB13444]
MLLAAAVIFLYYTVWTLLLPFLDESSPIHGWFPSREWALRIVSFVVILGISAIGLFLGFRVVTDETAAQKRHVHRKAL